ncbi:hypothetical protein BP5796_09386 [Coleophoma crateriformis]|uniref:TauD/TfdA-like domain-containing protein n=1 Tax=Coleophoma crateriformis TaxID=565419 RepID=A0A3D8QXY3_9HELO|nr:hypothetical protein BP5796_09386 [Coleophoma crateriformis]
MSTPLITTYENTCPARTATGVLRLRGASEPQLIRDGSLTIEPVLVSPNSAFGAEVSGIDWSRPIPPEMVKQLVALQDKYAVLIFRKTGLDNARHIAFSQQLGDKLEINPFFFGRENDRVGEPLLFDVANIELDGSLVKRDSRRWHHSLGNALWHTSRKQAILTRMQQDSSYHQQRSKYSILLSHGNPSVGGSWTHFADTRRAYADLPQAKKDEIEDLIIEHDLWHSRWLASPAIYSNPLPHELAAKPPAYHRLVQYVFSMEWLSGGDMVWWDNRQSMHRANIYTDQMTARDVRRSTIIDDGPLAFGVSEEEKVAAGWTPPSAAGP